MATPLTVADLFTPAPSGVGPFGNVPLVPPSGTWLTVELQIANTVQLATTSWQPGAPERTILAIEAVCFAESDVNISLMAQGAFGQSAASGSVQTVDLRTGVVTTIPVTADPSNASQNPSGALGWLDVWGQNTYATTRLASTQATGPLAIVNLKGSTIGPYSPQTYHVGSVGGATYSNPGTLTVPSSAIAGTGGQIAGVAIGPIFTTITTASAHGLTAGQTVYVQLPPATGVSIFPTGNPVPGSGFAIVISTSPTSFQIGVGSSGLWTAGGTVYLATVATMTADVAGVGSNAAPGSVVTPITQNAGVFVSNVVAWSGTNWESNLAYLARTVLSLASRSPNGPSQAYVYFAQTASQLFSPPYTLTNGPVQAFEFANPQTGIVTTVVASSSPVSTVLGAAVTPGCAQLGIVGLSNASPCVVSCGSNHGLTTGMSATLTFPAGAGPAALVAALSGAFTVTVLSPTTFSVPVNTTALGAWTGGGSIEGGDLGAIDALLQENVVPDNTTALTISALALPIQVTATVIVPQAYVAAYSVAVAAQLQTQFNSYAIGGNAPDFEVAYDDIVGALEEAGVVALGQASYVRQVQALSLNGKATGVGIPFPTNQYQAVLSAPAITVLGI